MGGYRRRFLSIDFHRSTCCLGDLCLTALPEPGPRDGCVAFLNVQRTKPPSDIQERKPPSDLQERKPPSTAPAAVRFASSPRPGPAPAALHPSTRPGQVPVEPGHALVTVPPAVPPLKTVAVQVGLAPGGACFPSPFSARQAVFCDAPNAPSATPDTP